jgi:hypothetical protein
MQAFDNLFAVSPSSPGAYFFSGYTQESEKSSLTSIQISFPFTQITEIRENGAMQQFSFYPNPQNMRKWGNAAAFLLPKFT